MARKPLRPLIRSGGFYPSRKWTPLVYAGGYTTANGGEEPAPPPIEKTVTGNPIHITDALAKPAQALSVKLEPIQDLHGYDNPWPAGGGENKIAWADGIDFTLKNIRYYVSGGKLYVNGTSTGETSSADAAFESNFEFTLKAGSYYFTRTTEELPTYLIHYVNGAKETLAVNEGAFTLAQDEEVWVGFYVYNKTFTNEHLPIQIVSGSTAPTVYSPYSNICPISGHTDADVTRTGKNLVKTKDSGRTNNQVTFTVNADGSIKAYGTATGGTAFFRSGGNPPEYGTYIKAGTYKLTGGISNTKILYLVGVYVDGTGISNSTVTGGVYDRGSGLTFTLLNDAYIAYQIQIVNGTEADDTFYPMICKDTSAVASDFSPYVGTTYPIPLGQTVYGGTLDVLTGVLTVSHKYKKPPKADIRRNQDTQFYVVVDSEIAMGTEVPCISNKFRPWDGTESLYKKEYYCFVNSGGAIRFNTTAEYSTVDDMYNAIGEMEFICQLATPQTIQLTPQQVKLLQGENNIFSDGEMTLVYLADGNASEIEALNILLGGRYVNNHGEDEPTDREALDILLGNTR